MTNMNDLRTISRVLAERDRQDREWGEQNHDNFTFVAVLAEEVGEVAQAALQANFENDGPERDDTDVAEELVQTAAVAVNFLGAIERRTTPRRRVYLSGPIAGVPDFRDRFAAAGEAARAKLGDVEIIDPCDVAVLSHDGVPCAPGYSAGENAGHSSACFMRTDLIALLTCDEIWMLPDHGRSRGATVELAVARACGMVVHSPYEQGQQPVNSVEAHIDGRAMDRAIAGGHEMVVTHDGDVAIYTPVCREPHGANCRLICAEGCTHYSGIAHDGEGPFHSVPIGWRHRMIDAGECQAVLWLEQDPGVTPELAEDGTDPFEIGRFGIRPVWTGCGVEWQRVTRPIEEPS